MSELPVIPLAEPCVGGNVRAYLDECLTTNFVSSVGPFVDRFEKEFAAYVGSRYAVACGSGTAALHLAMHVLDVGPGDEVLLPTLTFIASGNPVLYRGAAPVLVDSEETTWNLDPDLVIEEIERRARAGKRQPKVVEVVHILGHPARVDRLLDVCARHGIAVVEDAAEALGAQYRAGPHAGKHVGTLGKIGCYSFNGNKIITTGNGGMLTTDDEKLARRAKHLSTQARLPGAEYRHDEVGYNYRLSNLSAAMGVAQLEQLPDFLTKKRAIADRYDRFLATEAGLSAPPREAWANPSMWLYTMRVDPKVYGQSRQGLLETLGRHGVQSRPIWSPLHTMPMYAGAPRLGGAVAERLFAEALSLPCSVQLSEADQGRVTNALRRA